MIHPRIFNSFKSTAEISKNVLIHFECTPPHSSIPIMHYDIHVVVGLLFQPKHRKRGFFQQLLSLQCHALSYFSDKMAEVIKESFVWGISTRTALTYSYHFRHDVKYHSTYLQSEFYSPEQTGYYISSKTLLFPEDSIHFLRFIIKE